MGSIAYIYTCQFHFSSAVSHRQIETWHYLALSNSAKLKYLFQGKSDYKIVDIPAIKEEPLTGPKRRQIKTWVIRENSIHSCLPVNI